MIKLLSFAAILFTSCPQLCLADSQIQQGPFDEVLKLEFGQSHSDLEGEFSVDAQAAGRSVGTRISLEELLSLPSSSNDSHLRLNWQPYPRHRLSIERLNFERRSDTTASRDFQYGDLTIAADAAIGSRFDLAIDQYQYAYSVYRSQRQEARLSLGINVLKLDVGLNANGKGVISFGQQAAEIGGSYTVTNDSKTPVPVIGAGYSLAITPWWIVDAGVEYFEMDYQNNSGKVLSWQLSTEAHLAKYFVVGMRYSDYHFNITSEENRWRGQLDWHHNGPTVYMGLRLPAGDQTFHSTLFSHDSSKQSIEGPYLELSLGGSNQSSEFSRKTAASVSVKPEAGSRSDEDLSFALGYRVNTRFGVELGLFNFNKFWGNDRVKNGEQPSPNGGLQSYKLQSKMEVEAIIPWFTLHQSIGDKLELQGRIGYGFYDARYGVSGHIKVEEPGLKARAGYDESNSDHDNSIALGLGASWYLSSNWALGGQYQYHQADFSDSGNKADWNSHRLSINLRYSL